MMSFGNLRVATIVDSVRNGRFGPQVGVHRQLVEAGIAPDVIDLAEWTFPHTMAEHPDVESFTESIGRADAVVAATRRN